MSEERRILIHGGIAKHIPEGACGYRLTIMGGSQRRRNNEFKGARSADNRT